MSIKNYDSQKVFNQIKASRIFDNNFCQAVTGPYLLSEDIDPNSNNGLNYTIKLVSATGLTAGDKIGLFQDTSNPQSYFGIIKSISTNTLTMDTPIDGHFYVSLTPVLFEILCNAAVDGSTTPQIFSINNESSITIIINRIILAILDDKVMDNSLFGGIVELPRGVVLRKKHTDGTYNNYWGSAVKTNGEFKLLAYDVTYDVKAPAGLYGLTVRYTFGGPDKHISSVELEPGESLEFVVQDDLTSLDDLQIMAEGCFK